MSDTPGAEWAVVAVVQYLGEDGKDVIELARGTLAQCESYSARAAGTVKIPLGGGREIETPAVSIPIPAGRQAAGAVLSVVRVCDLPSGSEVESP